MQNAPTSIITIAKPFRPDLRQGKECRVRPGLPRPVKGKKPSFFWVAAVISGFILCVPVSGLSEPPSGASGPTEPDEAGVFVSHLGIEFVAVPGTSVLVGAIETRVSDYARFLEDTGHPPPDIPHFAQGPDHPVVGVSREDAEAFCRWLTESERSEGRLTAKQAYRLPTRTEWNLAVGLDEPFSGRNALEQEIRSKTFYPWGEEWPPSDNAGNFASAQIEGYNDAYVFTAPVKSFQPNQFGIFDLAGNVWEWCESDAVAGSPQWVLRGGAWIYFVPECLLASYEYRVPAGLKSSSFGFRCVFEDPDRVSEITREMMEAKKKEQDEARMRFVTERKEGAPLTPEEAEARKKELLKTDFAMAKGGPDVRDEDLQSARSRILDKLPDEGEGPDESGKTRWKTRPEGYAARLGTPFENSLGMKFQPLENTVALFGETEVRVGEYALFRKENSGIADPRATFKQSDEHPVVRVTWNDAVRFCDWLTRREREAGWISEKQSYRLPTDVEWSAASGIEAESGATPAERNKRQVDFFPWGSEWPPPNGTVNINALKIEGYQDKSTYTSESGKMTPNAAGVFDLGGNVSEWCLDSWTEGSAEKVIRGGSYLASEREQLVSSYRRKLDAASMPVNVGFRCVLVEE